MNATNLPPQAAIDSAASEVGRALIMLREALAGKQDADLYGCTMHHVELVLDNAASDLKAAGAH